MRVQLDAEPQMSKAGRCSITAHHQGQREWLECFFRLHNLHLFDFVYICIVYKLHRGRLRASLHVYALPQSLDFIW